jgi:hypothetical protein
MLGGGMCPFLVAAGIAGALTFSGFLLLELAAGTGESVAWATQASAAVAHASQASLYFLKPASLSPSSNALVAICAKPAAHAASGGSSNGPTIGSVGSFFVGLNTCLVALLAPAFNTSCTGLCGRVLALVTVFRESTI